MLANAFLHKSVQNRCEVVEVKAPKLSYLVLIYGGLREAEGPSCRQHGGVVALSNGQCFATLRVDHGYRCDSIQRHDERDF
eukprot:2245244-Pleurochrysis_carterae.AAC.1